VASPLKESESRQFGRYNVSHQVELIAGSTTLPATITNESIGGVRLQLDQPACFSVGEVIVIKQHETESKGYVRNIGGLEGGGMFAGVSWDPPADDEGNAVSKAKSDFFRYGKLDVVCRDRTQESDGTCRITLWDGATFLTESKRLTTVSRDSRQAQLERMQTEIPVLAKLYGVLSDGNSNEVSKRLLDFEFPTA
jgi:hypothetical protein